MKKLLNFVGILSLGAWLMVSACGSNDLTAPEEKLGEEQELSLEKEFGGFSTENEPVAFGEADMLTDFSEDAEVADPVSQDAAVRDVLVSDQAKVKAYFLRIAWGLLEGDSTATAVANFSGSAQVSRGTLVLLRTIKFEADDGIVLPRPNRQTLEFNSTIGRHYDGLALAIIDNDTTDTAGTFTFTAGDYAKTLSFSELDSLELLETVGSGPYEVSMVSRSKEIVPFAGGFIAGHWVRTRPNGGEFRGRWINSLGTNAGFLKGIWGVTRRGQKVFKGKYISMNGEFRGLLAGHWQYERDQKSGVFRGRWVNRNRQTVGTLHGKFKVGREGTRRGFFHGRYRITHRDRAESELGDDS